MPQKSTTADGKLLKSRGEQLQLIQDYFFQNNLSQGVDDAVNLIARSRPRDCFGALSLELSRRAHTAVLTSVSVIPHVNSSCQTTGKVTVVATLCGRSISESSIVPRINEVEATVAVKKNPEKKPPESPMMTRSLEDMLASLKGVPIDSTLGVAVEELAAKCQTASERVIIFTLSLALSKLSVRLNNELSQGPPLTHIFMNSKEISFKTSTPIRISVPIIAGNEEVMFLHISLIFAPKTSCSHTLDEFKSVTDAIYTALSKPALESIQSGKANKTKVPSPVQPTKNFFSYTIGKCPQIELNMNVTFRQVLDTVVKCIRSTSGSMVFQVEISFLKSSNMEKLRLILLDAKNDSQSEDTFESQLMAFYPELIGVELPQVHSNRKSKALTEISTISLLVNTTNPVILLDCFDSQLGNGDEVDLAYTAGIECIRLNSVTTASGIDILNRIFELL